MFENLDTTEKREYHCEGCGLKETLTQREAFEKGWDYPPFLGTWGIVSPRTCGNCGIDTTAYWAIITKAEITEKHLNTIRRIQAEVPDVQGQDEERSDAPGR